MGVSLSIGKEAWNKAFHLTNIDRDTWINKLRQILVSTPNRVASRYFDSRAKRAAERVAQRLEKPAKWIVPVGYWALISFCLHVFFRDTYPMLQLSTLRYESMLKSV